MSSRLALVFLVYFVAIQCSSALPRERRDTETEKPSDALTNIQNFFNENLKFDKIAENLKEFGEKISAGTKDLTENIQKKAEELFKSDTSKTDTKA